MSNEKPGGEREQQGPPERSGLRDFVPKPWQFTYREWCKPPITLYRGPTPQRYETDRSKFKGSFWSAFPRAGEQQPLLATKIRKITLTASELGKLIVPAWSYNEWFLLRPLPTERIEDVSAKEHAAHIAEVNQDNYVQLGRVYGVQWKRVDGRVVVYRSITNWMEAIGAALRRGVSLPDEIRWDYIHASLLNSEGRKMYEARVNGFENPT